MTLTEAPAQIFAGDPGSRVDFAIRAVTDHIRENGMRVGDSLPGEGHFADRLGVSRAVMREAFGALAALRLIDVANGRKARVGAMDGSIIAASLDHAVSTAQITVPEIWEVRRTIEVKTAALAAACRTDEEADRIVALAAEMVRSRDDMPTMTRIDIAFHEAIAKASHNALFVQIVASFAPLMEVAVPAAWRTRKAGSEPDVMLERHRRVAEAIRARDPAAAAAAMEDHFDAAVRNDLAAGGAN
ncbi:FadR/GntR family transcriptional regulator [Brevundimonas sp.]|uniref:FadR/GntR family transcriptional regulator n=1 Tax=Brevundimonas sp. TaxID=1871086 RepID=UPI003D134FCA